MRARVSWCDGVTREKRLKMTPYIYLESQKPLLKTLYLGGKPRHTCVTPASHLVLSGVTRLPFPAPCLPSVSHLSPLGVTLRCDAVTPYMCCISRIISLKNPYLAGQFFVSHRHTKKIGFCCFLHFNLSSMPRASSSFAFQAACSERQTPVEADAENQRPHMFRGCQLCSNRPPLPFLYPPVSGNPYKIARFCASPKVSPFLTHYLSKSGQTSQP